MVYKIISKLDEQLAGFPREYLTTYCITCIITIRQYRKISTKFTLASAKCRVVQYEYNFSQVMSAVASMLMDLTHAVFYLQLAFFGILCSALCTSSIQTHVPSLSATLPVQHLLYISSAANLPGLLVYLFIFPAFRKKAREMLTCRNRRQTAPPSRIGATVTGSRAIGGTT